MERNDEELLRGARPVVVVGTGQKVAGGVLRGFGLLLFLGGALGAMLALVLAMVEWCNPEGAIGWWGIAGMGGVGFGGMTMGSAMGVFGMMVAGSFRDVSGERFLKWALAVLLRDLALMTGMLVSFASLVGGATFQQWHLLMLVVPGGVLVWLGVLGGAVDDEGEGGTVRGRGARIPGKWS